MDVMREDREITDAEFERLIAPQRDRLLEIALRQLWPEIYGTLPLEDEWSPANRSAA
jgi:hypothetical protein